MTDSASEIFKAMSSSKILVAILKTQKEVLVPIDIFFGLNSEENLKVEFDDVSRNFLFKLSIVDSTNCITTITYYISK